MALNPFLSIVRIYLSTPIKNEDSEKKFRSELKSFLEKEVTKISDKDLKELKSSDADPFKVSLNKDRILIGYRGNTDQSELIKRDEELNKLLSYVKVSEYKIESMEFELSKTFILKTDEITKFFDKSYLVNFNTKMKKTLRPVGTMFSMKIEDSKDDEATIMFIEGEKDIMLDITIDRIIHEKTHWSLLSENNKLVNDIKHDIFTTLGES